MRVAENFTNEEIIEIINEMYDFRIKDGDYNDCPKLQKFYEEHPNFHSERMLYEYILHEASMRFDKVVVELFLKYPDKYLRRE